MTRSEDHAELVQVPTTQSALSMFRRYVSPPPPRTATALMAMRISSCYCPKCRSRYLVAPDPVRRVDKDGILGF